MNERDDAMQVIWIALRTKNKAVSTSELVGICHQLGGEYAADLRRRNEWIRAAREMTSRLAADCLRKFEELRYVEKTKGGGDEILWRRRRARKERARAGDLFDPSVYELAPWLRRSGA